MLIQLNDGNFIETIAQTDKIPLLVDFWTARQEACRYNAPVVHEISQEFDGRCNVGKVNVDDCPYMVGTYQIAFVPGMAIFHRGQLVMRIPGIVTKERIIGMLKEKGMI